MNVSGVVDSAIVLVAVYFALSFIVSQIYEQFAALLHLRGNMLYNAVVRLVMDDKGLADAIFTHPNIVSSAADWGVQAKRPALDKTAKATNQKSARPSYIDPRDFSIALWQTLAMQPAGQDIAPKALDLSKLAGPATVLSAAGDVVSKLPNKNLALAFYGILNNAASDYDGVLAATDDWFNRQMDRVEGWYKRRAQYWIALIAAVVVLLLGVDTVRIVTSLYTNDAMRAQLSQAVVKGMGTPSPATQSKPGVIDDDQRTKLFAALDDRAFLNIFASGPIWDVPNPTTHVVGEIITFLAVMLGAPFWFDLLSKIINLRLAGSKPDDNSNPKKSS